MSPDPLGPAAVNPLDPDPPPAVDVCEHPGWFLALGLAQVLVGAVALGLAAFTTLLAVVLLGGLALAGAAVELVTAFAAWTWPEGLARAVVGLLYGVFGLMLLANPELAAATLTLVLAVLLLATGATRFVFAAAGRYRGWGWAAAGGAVAALSGPAGRTTASG
ncbi:MAG TPA: DUF308 domain-containing protein [Urbifossiella sp.]|nr:DUF308 domain-containing protein [Urbifossiella sp.]